jgi:hypothetical protein
VPVEIVVHATGLSAGSIVFSFEKLPISFSLKKFGSMPSLISLLVTFGSMPSMPMTITFLLRPAVFRLAFAAYNGLAFMAAANAAAATDVSLINSLRFILLLFF